MNKKELEILGKAFEKEFTSALSGSCHLLQTKSKIAEKLADEGMLEKLTTTLRGGFPVEVTGYALTHAGRYEYCSSLD